MNLGTGMVLSNSTGTHVSLWGPNAGGDVTNKTLDDLKTAGVSIIKISDATIVTSDFIVDTGTGKHWESAISAGPLASYNGALYIAPTAISEYTFPLGG